MIDELINTRRFFKLFTGKQNQDIIQEASKYIGTVRKQKEENPYANNNTHRLQNQIKSDTIHGEIVRPPPRKETSFPLDNDKDYLVKMLIKE